jgi:gliding motility-associated-like protein
LSINQVFKTALFILKIQFVCFYVSGQTIADNWFFGHKGGVNFSSNSYTVLTSGQLYTIEGVASISDQNGNLLFYTDGDTVWNKQHQVMPNGTGLLGNASATQAALICPTPNDSTRYYIFTLDHLAQSFGCRYSIVDLTLDGGNGDIDTAFKNILIETPVCEKITAVEKCDKSGYWIIIHPYNSSTLKAYELSSSGLNTNNPIVSNTSVSIDTSNSQGLGYMRATPDGKILGMCHQEGDVSKIELLKFNSNTGQAIDPIVLQCTHPDSNAPGWPYGIEYSPDQKHMYTSGKNAIYQYTISVYDSATIEGSKSVIYKDSFYYGTALQLGPDQKIYSNNGDFLNVINQPNNEGLACGFEVNAVDLLGRYSGFGLPNFLPNTFYNPIPNKVTCIEDSILFEFTLGCVDSVKWIFADSGSGSSNISLDTSVYHKFSDTGTFVVTLIAFYPSINDTFQNTIVVVSPPDPQVLNDTLLICKGDSAILNAKHFGSQYSWSTGSDSSAIKISSTGTYAVTISNICSTLIDSILVLEMDSITIDIHADSILCEDETIQISSQFNQISTSLTWSNGDTFGFEKSINHIAGADTVIWLTVTNACGSASDTVTIVSIPEPDVSWFSDSILCEQNDLVISEPAIAGQRHFLTTSESPIILDSISRPWVIDTAGIYFLHAYNVCDTISKEAFLSPYQQIKVDLGADTIICEGDSVFLDATWPNSSYAWSTGELDSSVSVSDEGNYVVTITNVPCQMVEQRQVFFTNPPCDSVVCKFSVPNVFTPNADGINDQLKISNMCSVVAYQVFIYNRWGQLVFQQNVPYSSNSDQMAFVQWDGYVNGSISSPGAYFVVIESEDGKSQRSSAMLMR